MRDERGGPDRYDLVPYDGGLQPAAHCRRLEAVATVFGLPAAPLCSARVLDLGCGMGAALLPQALEYPAARFVGCDRAEAQIAHAAEVAAALGLQNVELWHRDLSDANAGWGRFDYILCHGVFSWVGPDVRRRILEILRDNLAPHGVAYVSFNALPAWHLRRVARDLMCHHSVQFTDPQQAIAQARAMLAVTAEAQMGDDAFAALVREEYFRLSQAGDSYLFHEMLAEHNQPFYFREFIGQIESVGLQYLGAADMPRMFTWDLPRVARDFLEPMPLLVREQYLDFLRGAAFRRCLLCHAGVKLDHRPKPSVLTRFFVGLSRAARAQVPRASEAEPGMSMAGEEYGQLVIGSCKLLVPNALAAAAVGYLDEQRPEFISVHELFGVASQRLSRRAPASGGDQQTREQVLRFLMDAVTAGALDAAISAPRLTGRAGERPAVSPLARFQAESANVLTNQKHEPIQITDVERLVARSLDGTRDRKALAEAVGQALAAGVVSLGPFAEATEAGDIDQVVEDALQFFGRAALLVA
jgi:SAM-dependent methyltransferase